MSRVFSGGVVVYVKELPRARAFYESVAGFGVADVAADNVVLRLAAFELVLVQIPETLAATIAISDPPQKRTDNPVKLIIPVTSIASARATAPKFGGELLSPEREWEFQGARVCDGHDPEGNVIQFRQSAEETPRRQ